MGWASYSALVLGAMLPASCGYTGLGGSSQEPPGMTGGPVETVRSDEYADRAFAESYDKLGEVLDRQRRHEALPDSDPLGGETKPSNQRRISQLFAQILSTLQASRLAALIDERQANERAIRAAQTEIAAAEQAALTAPPTVPWYSTARSQRHHREAAQREQKKIEALHRRQEQIVLAVRISLRSQGRELSPDQSRFLLDDPAALEALRLNAALVNARQVDLRLAELIARAGGNTFVARRNFRLHMALLEVLPEPLRQAQGRVDANYAPPVRKLLADNAARRAELQRMLLAADADGRKTIEADLRAQELADQAAQAYLAYLADWRLRVAQAQDSLKRGQADAQRALDSQRTAETLAALVKSPGQDLAALGASVLPAPPATAEPEVRRKLEELSRQTKEK